jgi:hypothetical protein
LQNRLQEVGRKEMEVLQMTAVMKLAAEGY